MRAFPVDGPASVRETPPRGLDRLTSSSVGESVHVEGRLQRQSATGNQGPTDDLILDVEASDNTRTATSVPTTWKASPTARV